MRRRTIIIAVTVATTFAAYAAYYPFSPAAVQARNMRTAEAFIPAARASISNDRRFEHVELYPYTGDGGSLGIGGAVRSGDLVELKKRIEAMTPPVHVSWQVKEFEEPLFSELLKVEGNAH